MATRKYRVTTPNGQKLTITGPDNATPEEIKAAASRAWDKIKPSEFSKEDIQEASDAAKNAPAKMADTGHGIADTLWKMGTSSLMGNPVQAFKAAGDYWNSSTNDKLADAGGLARDGAAATLGALAGLALGPEAAPAGAAIPGVLSTGGASVAASATMAYMDQILRSFTGQGTGSEISDNPIIAGALGTIENEVGGRILGVIGKAFTKGKLIDRVPGITEELKNLKPTYAQFDPAVRGSDFLEDSLANVSKKKGIEESATLAKARVEELVDQTTKLLPSAGRHGLYGTAKSPRFGASVKAELIQAETKGAHGKFIAESNREANNAIATAELFQYVPQRPTTVTSQVPVVGSLTGQTQAVTNTVMVPGNPIAGPVWATEAIPELAKIRKELIPTSLTPNPDTPVFRAVDQIFTDMHAQFDDLGNLVSYEPLSFKQAWHNKKIIDDIGYGNIAENLNYTDSRFRKISEALNRDIDTSIPKWSTNPADINTLKAANDAWHQSKAIVSKRHELFYPMGEVGKSSDTLLSSVNAPSKIVDTMLKDYKTLGRFLEHGEAMVNGKRIFSSNGRRDMQGYAVEKMFYDHWTPTDPGNIHAGIIDGDKLASSWTTFIQSPEGKTLFGPKDGALVARYNDFFDAVRKTSAGGTPNRWVTMSIGTKSLGLGAATLAGSFGAGFLGGVGVVGGALSMSGLARVMTSKKYGPALLGLMHGRPLGMSFQAATRGIIQSASGSHITLEHEDGTSQQGIIGTDGKIRPVTSKQE